MIQNTERMDMREAALGAFAIVLGIAVGIGAVGIGGGSAYDVLGPSLLPYIIAGGLVLSGLPILIGALLKRRSEEEPEALDAMPVVLIVQALAFPIPLIVPLGWIPTVTVSFALGARAFGSRRPLVDLAIGLALATAIFVIFNEVLGLHLPAGSLVTRLLGI